MRKLGTLYLATLLAGCAAFENEMDIPLSEVPEPAMRAARQAVPGIRIDEAEVETEDGKQIYELSGEANGKGYEIEVSGTGEILEVEED